MRRIDTIPCTPPPGRGQRAQRFQASLVSVFNSREETDEIKRGVDILPAGTTAESDCWARDNRTAGRQESLAHPCPIRGARCDRAPTFVPYSFCGAVNRAPGSA